MCEQGNIQDLGVTDPARVAEAPASREEIVSILRKIDYRDPIIYHFYAYLHQAIFEDS